jgi:hypothetical protein
MASLLMVLAVLPAPEARSQGTAPVGAFRGLGAWVDVFDGKLYRDPEGTVAELSRQGVQTLFLETTSYRLRGPLRFPRQAGRFLDAAHGAGMKVVAWYVPDFVDLDRDLEWSVAATTFRNPAGETFDAFGLDIEVTAVRDHGERARRVVQLSRRIRAAVGDDYPLAAITPSPLRGSGYWPIFPDRQLAGIYDVYMPMAYWTYSANSESGAEDYIRRSIDIVRRETGRPDIPIHVIGGLADPATAGQMRGFVRAVRAGGVLGASMYDAAISGPEDWRALQAVRAEEPAEPAPRRRRFPRPGRDLEARGPLDGRGSDRVRFRTGPLPGDWELDLEAYDADPREVEVTVNGERAGMVPSGPRQEWGERRTLALPRQMLRRNGPNDLRFVSRRNKARWGVRRVALAAGPVALESRDPYGALAGAGPGREDRVTYEFTPEGQPVSLQVRGYDLNEDEVRVTVNGRLAGWLSATPEGGWGEGESLVLRPELLVPGRNLLTFASIRRPGRDDPWGVRIDRSGPATFA